MIKNKMNHIFLSLLVSVLLLLPAVDSQCRIDGVTGTSFNFTARSGHISTPEGGSILFWGYGNGSQPAQYPGPTLIIDQGDTVTITLTNELSMPVSLVFPGHENVTAQGGVQGLITREAMPSDDPATPVDESTVVYTFTASQPGTYHYHSGTRPELQVEMGLVGAIIVRPSGFDPSAPTAYGHPDSAYDREYLFLLTEMDPRIHVMIENQGLSSLAGTDYLSNYFPNYWFINGRCAPDTMSDPFVPWLPSQPYNCLPRMHPGEKLLLRVIDGGRDLHPFHHHGNNSYIIARDGRLLETTPGAGPDMGMSVFTIKAFPGGTADAIFEWTGKDLGWDIYGTGPEFAHECLDNDGDGFDDTTKEYCPDHGKPLPVVLPENQSLAFGDFYSGSPYLGKKGILPPGAGTLNIYGGYFYMWHSHAEKEMLNYNVFPGGMMTMLIVEPPGTPIP